MHIILANKTTLFECAGFAYVRERGSTNIPERIIKGAEDKSLNIHSSNAQRSRSIRYTILEAAHLALPALFISVAEWICNLFHIFILVLIGVSDALVASTPFDLSVVRFCACVPPNTPYIQF